jgi:hypothetical protein
VRPLLQGPFDRWAFASRRAADAAGAGTLSASVIAALSVMKRREGEAVVQMGVPSPEDAEVFAPLLVPAGSVAACITAQPPFAAAFLFAMLDAAHRTASPMRPERDLSSLPVAMVVRDATVVLDGSGPFAALARRLAEAAWTVRVLDSLAFQERHARPAGTRLLELTGRPATPYRQEPGTQ